MAEWFQAVRASLARGQQEMVGLLGELVGIESGSRDKEGVDRLGARLSVELEKLGFQLDYYPQERCGNHIRAVLEGSGRGRVLILGHLDTVWPRGTLAEWPFRVEGGRAYGPGVGDMRGGLVVALYALRALEAAGAPLPRRLAFVLTADEELGSPTARGLVEAEARQSNAALVVEPGRPEGAVVTARGGVGICELRARGRTAHAGYFDETGASAIEALARQVVALHALTRREDGISVNVGMVQGGSARQVVADHAWALVDLRAPTPEAARALDLEILRAVGSYPPGTSVEAGITWTRPPAPRPAATDGLMGVAREVARDLGLGLSEVTWGSGSDGNFVAALGVPILDTLGPVSARVCSRDEFVELETMIPRAALLAGILGRLAEGVFSSKLMPR